MKQRDLTVAGKITKIESGANFTNGLPHFTCQTSFGVLVIPTANIDNYSINQTFLIKITFDEVVK